MTERELSTSDLAARESAEPDPSLENQRPEPDAADEPDASLENQQAELDATDDSAEPLFANEESENFTNRWQEIQTSFVDQPRDAVAQADALVAELMQRLAGSFSQEREQLEAQWDRGDDVSTEDLRVALTRYRSFFDRLLSV